MVNVSAESDGLEESMSKEGKCSEGVVHTDTLTNINVGVTDRNDGGNEESVDQGVVDHNDNDDTTVSDDTNQEVDAESKSKEGTDVGQDIPNEDLHTNIQLENSNNKVEDHSNIATNASDRANISGDPHAKGKGDDSNDESDSEDNIDGRHDNEEVNDRNGNSDDNIVLIADDDLSLDNVLPKALRADAIVPHEGESVLNSSGKNQQ